MSDTDDLIAWHENEVRHYVDGTEHREKHAETAQALRELQMTAEAEACAVGTLTRELQQLRSGSDIIYQVFALLFSVMLIAEVSMWAWYHLHGGSLFPRIFWQTVFGVAQTWLLIGMYKTWPSNLREGER